MALLSKENKQGTDGKNFSGATQWSKWRTAAASLALAGMAAGCTYTPTSIGGCYIGDSGDGGGSACLCNTDAGVIPGAYSDAGLCAPAGDSGVIPAPVCPADPNPNCVPQSPSKQLVVDGGANSTLVVGDYTVTLVGTSQSGSNFAANVSLSDFCGNALGTQSVALGSPAQFTENNGNIVITVSLSQTPTYASASLTAVMACPNDVISDAGIATGAVCPFVTTGNSGGLLYTKSVESVAGYSFAYLGNTGGFANILVSCDEVTIANLQCTVGTPKVIARQMDNGGRTITVNASSATLDYADVTINVSH